VKIKMKTVNEMIVVYLYNGKTLDFKGNVEARTDGRENLGIYENGRSIAVIKGPAWDYYEIKSIRADS